MGGEGGSRERERREGGGAEFPSLESSRSHPDAVPDSGCRVSPVGSPRVGFIHVVLVAGIGPPPPPPPPSKVGGTHAPEGRRQRWNPFFSPLIPPSPQKIRNFGCGKKEGGGGCEDFGAAEPLLSLGEGGGVRGGGSFAP